MMHERHENIEADIFFAEGQQLLEKEQQEQEEWEQQRNEALVEEEASYDNDETIGLLEGKIKREHLKEVLFQYLSQQVYWVEKDVIEVSPGITIGFDNHL